MSYGTNNTSVITAENWVYPPVYYEKLQHSFNLVKIMGIVIIMVGTVGNVLSIAVMQRRNFRTTTTSLYIRVLAMVDTACLYVGLVPFWIRYTFGYAIDTRSDWSCKLLSFLIYTIPQIEAWLLVSVSLERLTAVYHPLKAKVWFSQKRSAVGMVTLAVIISLLNGHLFLLQRGYDKHGNVTICEMEEKTPVWHYHNFIFKWAAFLVASFLPLASILASNVAIIIKMAVLRKRKLEMQGGSTVGRDTPGISSMTTMLVVCCIIFLVTTTPTLAGNAVYEFLLQDAWKKKDVDALVQLETAKIVLLLLWYCNFAVNFFTYVVGGARFRSELSTMCCKQRRRGGKVDTNVTLVTVEP